MKYSTQSILENDMCIDMTCINNKLNSYDIKNSAIEIEGYLDVISDAYIKHGSSSIVESIILTEFTSRKSLMSNEDSVQVLDALRHSFNNFVTGGIKDLYHFQENEEWHPKLIINEVIDVEEIETEIDPINIYRGCSKEELISGCFEQSWSVEKSIAEEFAFENYKHQPWFSSSDRIVVRATIPKHGVFLTRLWHYEKELVVSTALLSNIEQCT
ncbi:hypothetical protein AKG98_3645 [Moritella sp. JT01]|uniref:hypothetical protein n=1 Tax=Moritella sp. JT01 TaxID=756698 RepID=UPI00079B5A50|nr:hypothetical protein [Moritella sp. JT01]KXO12452.1 hypothetical protein AKG98_3645 [Moritella sp. JT01]